MKPDLRLRGEGNLYTHLDGVPSPPENPERVGYVEEYCTGKIWPDGKHIYQVGASKWGDWCCSQWEQPPPDELWLINGRMGVLFTYVKTDNLNFSNTPLELRHSLSVHPDDPTLEILAQNERLLWRGARKTFIPFKRSYPQGYQGVWMNPYLMTSAIGSIIHVHDKFRPGHVLEIG